MKRLSMKDVAKAAGVSQPAVSYAYNRPDRISEGQRIRILKVAAKIGYPGPNALGRSLRSGTVGAIGFMMMDKLSLAFDDPATVALLKGIGHSGEIENFALTLFPLNHSTILSGATVNASLAVRGLVDGLIMTTLPDNHPVIDQVRDQHIPFVIVDAPKLEGANFIGIDDYGAARLQMQHLLELGHRRIGILVDRLAPDNCVGPVTRMRFNKAVEAVNRERVRAYVDGAADIGLAYDDLIIYEAGGLGETAGRSAAFTVLTTSKVTGIIATSDVMALATIKAAQDLDISVPEKMSVIGFDDIPDAVRAGLTTIRQPMVEKGMAASQFMRTLLDAKEPPEEPMVKLFDTRLVIRSSTRGV